jgi:hypothetical protein
MYHRGMGNRASVIIGVLILVAGAVALIVWSSMGLVRHTGEICITYNGRTECRVASGQTEEEAIRTATDMACSMLASGMTDRINCSNTRPSRITWQE